MSASSRRPGASGRMSVAATVDAARFWPRVDTSGGLFACWPWQGKPIALGYGIIRVGGRRGHNVLAHRVSWQLANGPIPDGMVVRHSCDNPPCCNPAHLAVGTHADNVADKVERGRQAKGEHNGRARLTEDDVRAVRLRADQESLTDLAREYGVDRRSIVYIVQRTTWKHVA